MHRVLIFSQEYPPYTWGGVAPFTVNLVNGLQSFGVEVQLITLGDKEETFVQANGVKVCRLTARGIYKDEFFDTDEGVKRHFVFLKKAKQLYQKDSKPDAVILADGLSYPEAKGCANYFKVPLVTMVNQIFSDIHELWKGELTQMMKLEKLYFENSDHLVVGSQYMLQRIQALGYGAKSSHIYYGWGYNQWLTSDRSFDDFNKQNRFLFVGRMVPEKGIMALLEAYKKALENLADAQLILVGDGPIRALAEEFIVKHKLQNAVKLKGSLPWSEISSAFKWAKFCIVPSFNEPFGYVALESIMYGAIPIVSAVGGLKEIAQSVNFNCVLPTEKKADFVEMPQINSFAQKLIECSTISEKKRQEIVSCARVDATKRFNYLTIAAEWLNLMRSL